MKCLLTIILFIFCTTSVVMADETVDSLDYYLQLADSAYEADNIEEECNYHEYALSFYLNEHEDVSQDTVYAFLLEQYGDICNRSEDYEAAIEALTEASQIYKSVFGESHPDYARSLSELASCYSNIGDYNEAIRKESEALEILKILLGNDNPDYASALEELAFYYYQKDNYDEAIRLGTEALEIRKNTSGSNQSDYASTLSKLARFYSNIKDYNEAIRLDKEAIEIYKQAHETDHPGYTTSLNDLGLNYFNAGDYEGAIKLGTEAVKTGKIIMGSEHPLYIESINNLANYYIALDNYSKAIQLKSDALTVIKETLGPDHPDYATVLEELAICYFNDDKFDDAIRLGSEVLMLRTKLLKHDDPEYARTLENLALFFYKYGKSDEAIRLGTKALEIRKNTLEPDSSEIASLLHNLALYHSDYGNYCKAIQLASEEKEIIQKTIGEKTPEYAGALANLSVCYSDFGNYDEAIRLGVEALEIRKGTLGIVHLSCAASMNNLSYNYYNVGNYSEAIRLGNEAIDVYKSATKIDSTEYANSLANLALSYYAIGNYDEAIRLDTEALNIYKVGTNIDSYVGLLEDLSIYHSRIGSYDDVIQLYSEAMSIIKESENFDSLNYSLSLARFSDSFFALGDYDKAIQLGTEAINIIKEQENFDSLSYALLLHNLTLYHSKNGNYNEAIYFGTEAMNIIKREKGINHPDYAMSLFNLALYYSFFENYNKAIPLLNDYVTIMKKNILVTFSGLTANERQRYWDKFSFKLNQKIPKIIVQSGIPDAAPWLYNNTALFAKGMLLSTELELGNIIQESDDKEAIVMYSELHQNRQLLIDQYSKPIANRNIDCDSLERVSSDIERQLVTRVKEFGDFTRNLSITWRDVQNKIGEDDIAVEFLSYQENDSTTTYAALTLCKSDTTPALTQLFTEHELIEASGDDETHLTSKADDLIWGPLSSRLEGKTHIYFSASGLLHNIGIEYLPSMEGKECHRLSSTRELVTHHTSSTIGSATLYGGIDYNASYASIESSVPNSVKDYAMTASTSQYRGRFDYRTMRYGVSALPGTKEEITEVSAMLKHLGTSFETLSGAQASEESFKALSGLRKNLLHISTHGFYYNTEEADNMSDNMRLMFIGENRPRNVEDQSLLRCGLCFAGANQILSGESQPSDGQDDGILNALEIAQTDLRGLDLVVLSACQTALGDVVNGEGVFGLQRGFKKAGAQSILMSLWEVDDEVTHILMTEFYRGWTDGMTKTQALRKAQAIVKEKYPDPKYWAAFILLDALD